MIEYFSLKDFAKASFLLVTFSKSQSSTIPYHHGWFNNGGYVFVKFSDGNIFFLLKKRKLDNSYILT